MLYALGVGLGQDPVERGRARLRLREEPQGVADLRGGARLSPASGLRDLDTGIDWVKAGARRAGVRVPQAAGAARDGGRQDAHRRRDRQGRRARARWFSPSARSSTRRPASRSRPSRRPRSAGAMAASAARRARRRRRIDSRARARSRLRSVDPAGGGADLSALRRSSIRCMPIPRSPRRPASRARSCTASPPSASPAMPCSRACATMIRRGSPPWPGASPRRCFPARPSAPRSGATAMWRASVPACVERDIVAINNGRAEVRA